MTSRYLEITYRGGQPFAAYLMLARRPGDRVARSCEVGEGLVADYANDGRVIGIELTNPSPDTLGALNRALHALGLDPLSPRDAAPLAAA